MNQVEQIPPREKDPSVLENELARLHALLYDGIISPELEIKKWAMARIEYLHTNMAAGSF